MTRPVFPSPRKTTNLRTLAAFALLGLSVAACRPAQTVVEAPPRPVRTVAAVMAPMNEVERYAAVIKPRIEADLGFRVAGKVVERLVEVGQRVTDGQPLARLDPADLELQVRAARAQLAAARADADNARVDYERYERLKQGEWTTTQERDRRKTLLDKADAHVREAEASLNVLVNSLQYATLTADGPGVVTATLVEPGQVTAAGQAAIRVARDGELEAVANIPENRLAGLDGKTLSVELWSLPGAAVAAKLREVAPTADAAVRTFQTRATLVDPPAGVQFGMTATLVARDVGAAPAARLPLTALTQADGAPAVWVVEGDEKRLALRRVSVAAYAGDDALVTGGLADGERVVTAGVHKLTAGEKVRLWVEAAR